MKYYYKNKQNFLRKNYLMVNLQLNLVIIQYNFLVQVQYPLKNFWLSTNFLYFLRSQGFHLQQNLIHLEKQLVIHKDIFPFFFWKERDLEFKNKKRKEKKKKMSTFGVFFLLGFGEGGSERGCWGGLRGCIWLTWTGGLSAFWKGFFSVGGFCGFCTVTLFVETLRSMEAKGFGWGCGRGFEFVVGVSPLISFFFFFLKN